MSRKVSADVWHDVFTFIPMHEPQLHDLMLVCKPFFDVLSKMDQVKCCQLAAHLEQRIEHIYELPSLDFLKTPQATKIMKAQMRFLGFNQLLDRVSYLVHCYGSEHGAQYLEILKNCAWFVPEKVDFQCFEVETLISDLKTLFSRLDDLTEEQCPNIGEIWTLLEKCENYCTKRFENHATLVQSFKPQREYDVDSVAAKCYSLIIEQQLKHQHRLLYLTAANYGFWNDEEPHILEYIPESLKTDEEIVLKCLQNDGYAYIYVDESFAHDKAMILIAMKTRNIFEHIDDKELLNDKDIVIAALKHDHSHFYELNEELQKDRDVLCAALESDLIPTDDFLLQYVDPKLYSDDETMISSAVGVDAAFIENASERLLNDREFLRRIVTVEPYCLEYLPLIARNDKRIVIKAIRKNPVVVEFVSEELKNDRDIVMCCMKHELASVALNHLPEYWRDDYDVILTAVTNCGPALHYASERLRNNTTLVEAAIEHGQYSVIEYLSDELRNCKSLMMKLIVAFPGSNLLLDVSADLKNDLEVVWTGVNTMHEEEVIEYFCEYTSENIQNKVQEIQKLNSEKSIKAAIEELWRQFTDGKQHMSQPFNEYN